MDSLQNNREYGHPARRRARAGHARRHCVAERDKPGQKKKECVKKGCSLFKHTKKDPLVDPTAVPPSHLPLKKCPLPPLQSPRALPSLPLLLLSLRSRCIVGRKVVAIRPLRGLRGRSENPEIHYAFKTFIYFRITYILSPGGPTATQNTTAVHLFSGQRELVPTFFICRRGNTVEKVKILTYIKKKCPVRETAGRWLFEGVD